MVPPRPRDQGPPGPAGPARTSAAGSADPASPAGWRRGPRDERRSPRLPAPVRSRLGPPGMRFRLRHSPVRHSPGSFPVRHFQCVMRRRSGCPRVRAEPSGPRLAARASRRESLRVPDWPPDDGRPVGPAWSGPVRRAAPTWLAPPARMRGRSRRWVIVGSLAAAGLLAGASAALAEAGSGPPAHAPAVARSVTPAPSAPAPGSH